MKRIRANPRHPRHPRSIDPYTDVKTALRRRGQPGIAVRSGHHPGELAPSSYSKQIEVEFDKFSRSDGGAVESSRGKTDHPRGEYCPPCQTVGQAARHTNSGDRPFGGEIRAYDNRSLEPIDTCDLCIFRRHFVQYCRRFWRLALIVNQRRLPLPIRLLGRFTEKIEITFEDDP